MWRDPTSPTPQPESDPIGDRLVAAIAANAAPEPAGDVPGIEKIITKFGFLPDTSVMKVATECVIEAVAAALLEWHLRKVPYDAECWNSSSAMAGSGCAIWAKLLGISFTDCKFRLIDAMERQQKAVKP